MKPDPPEPTWAAIIAILSLMGVLMGVLLTVAITVASSIH